MQIAEGVDIGFEVTFEGGLGGTKIIGFAFPGEEDRLLQRTAKSETNRPREGGVLADGGERFGGSLGVLSAAKEKNASSVTRDGVAQYGGGGHADGVGGSNSGGGLAALNDTSLKNAAAKVNMTLLEFFENGAEDAVGSGSGSFDSVIAVPENIGFDNGNEAGELTFFGEASEKVGIAFDGDEAGLVFLQTEGGAPFRETETVGISSTSVLVNGVNTGSIRLASFG